jgi:nucleotide-binding universal stress UspA family protein
MIQIKRILCPVDFSEYSRRALDHAIGVARCYGSTIAALHVVDAPVAVAPVADYMAVGVPPMMGLPADRAVLAAQLARFVAAESAPGVAVESLLEEAPSVHGEIVAQAARLKADLVVMGTHGRSGFERLFLGSTAEKVLRKTQVPVMTVPPHSPDAAPRGPVAFSRILCAVDFSPSAERAFAYALSLASEGHCSLTLLHAVDVMPLYYDFTPPAVVDVDAWSAQAKTRLQDMIPASATGACSTTSVVRLGTPSRQIIDLATEIAADLIVMGVQGRGAADLLLFGSTTHAVLREAHCAVLTVRG